MSNKLDKILKNVLEPNRISDLFATRKEIQSANRKINNDREIMKIINQLELILDQIENKKF